MRLCGNLSRRSRRTEARLTEGFRTNARVCLVEIKHVLGEAGNGGPGRENQGGATLD